jgi:hypothetical protein
MITGNHRPGESLFLKGMAGILQLIFRLKPEPVCLRADRSGGCPVEVRKIKLS